MYEAADVGAGVIALPPDELVDSLKQVLGTNSDTVDTLVKSLVPVPASRFGGSSSGATLGYYANLAHEKMLGELSGMAVGLLGLKKALTDYQNGVKDADDEARRALEALAPYVDQSSLAAIAGDLGVTAPTSAPQRSGSVRAV